MPIPEYWFNFTDMSENPLIDPPPGDWLIGDPAVLAPDSTPDGKWHLWAWAVMGQTIHHYLSDDGVAWKRLAPAFKKGLRPFILREGGEYLMYYEKFNSIRHTEIAVRRSTDLYNWSDPTVVLSPSLPWEGKWFRANGNPCVVKGSFGYRLYYSAGFVFLWDCLFPEPKFIGAAESDSPTGPFRKLDKPIISPTPDVVYRNYGAGAIKVYRDAGEWIGLNNGIYIDRRRHSRSAIMILKSDDGLKWELARKEPILAPEPIGWKRAFVYQLDVVKYKDELRLYYNARDGWFIGRERLGAARARIL